MIGFAIATTATGFVIGVFVTRIIAGAICAEKKHETAEDEYAKGYCEGWDHGYIIGVRHKFDRRIK